MRIEDSDILVELYRGAEQVPPWQGFLQRLGDRATALLVIQGSQGLWVLGGADLPWTADALLRLRYQRVYAAEELAGPRGFAFARILRVRADGGDAWLIVGRDNAEFPAAFTLMLSGLGPHLAVAMASHFAQSQMREQVVLMDRMAAKFQTGFVTLDAAGTILNASPFALQILAGSRAIYGQIGGKLTLPKALSDALHSFAAGQVEPVAITVSNLQILIQPYWEGSHMDRPLAVVHLRAEMPPPENVAKCLATLARITPSEARFALKLAEGLTIAEAGAALGLTLETARHYSKQIYSKMDLRGQSDLIRYLQNSVIPLI